MVGQLTLDQHIGVRIWLMIQRRMVSGMHGGSLTGLGPAPIAPGTRYSCLPKAALVAV
jgi:hypothetical protein